MPITVELRFRISFQANTLINRNIPEWFERVLEIIAGEANKPIEDIRTLSRQWAQIPECLKYVQLGNPELIFICHKTFFHRTEAEEIKE